MEFHLYDPHPTQSNAKYYIIYCRWREIGIKSGLFALSTMFATRWRNTQVGPNYLFINYKHFKAMLKLLIITYNFCKNIHLLHTSTSDERINYDNDDPCRWKVAENFWKRPQRTNGTFPPSNLSKLEFEYFQATEWLKPRQWETSR